MDDKQTMEIYNCTVRLAGNIMQTVPRVNVTQREVNLLRAIHGADAIVDLKSVDIIELTRPELEELHMKLAREYGRAKVEKAFGIILDHFDEWLASKQDEQANATEERIADSDRRFRDQQRAQQAGQQPAAA